MKHFSHFSAAQKVMLALLVGIVAVPVSSTALFLQQSAVETLSSNPQNLRQKALEDRSRLRAQRRLYWQAIEQFQHGKDAGLDVEKPDFNNTNTYEKAYGSAPEQAVEPEQAVSSLTTNQLESHDRALLRRYTRAGFCPEGLKDFPVKGFYELCTSLVGDSVKDSPVTGLLNHKAYLYQKLRGAAPDQDMSDFKLRMKMMDQARNGYKRDGGMLPVRPTRCVMNPNCLR